MVSKLLAVAGLAGITFLLAALFRQAREVVELRARLVEKPAECHRLEEALEKPADAWAMINLEHFIALPYQTYGRLIRLLLKAERCLRGAVHLTPADRQLMDEIAQRWLDSPVAVKREDGLFTLEDGAWQVRVSDEAMLLKDLTRRNEEETAPRIRREGG